MKVSILLAVLIIVSQSAFYETLQKQFNQLRVKSIQEVIPQTNVQQTKAYQTQGKQTIIQQLFDVQSVELQAQLTAYEQNYNSYLGNGNKQQEGITQKKWRPDPELSSTFDLHTESRLQSFIVKGQQLSQLVIDIAITNADPLDTKNEGIFFAIINLSSMSNDLQGIVQQEWPKALKQTLNQYIQYKSQVRKHHFIVLPFTSDIYEILIFKHHEKDEKFTSIHVSLQIKIQLEQVVVNGNNNNQPKLLTPQEEQQMVKNMKTIAEQNQITFLDSLQLWQKIQSHRKQNQSMLEWNQSIEWYECLGLVLMYVVEYGIFRFITTKKTVI